MQKWKKLSILASLKIFGLGVGVALMLSLETFFGSSEETRNKWIEYYAMKSEEIRAKSKLMSHKAMQKQAILVQ
jgi:hypothetical protein